MNDRDIAVRLMALDALGPDAIDACDDYRQSFDAWLAEDHDGECQGDPWVCNRCKAEQALARVPAAKQLFVLNGGSQFEPAPVRPGKFDLDGQPHMLDPKGRKTPVEVISGADLVEDEVVRKIIGYALALSGQVSRFKGHTFEDLGDFEALLAQEYGATKGGAKGNKTFMTYDGCMKVQIQVADHIDFGPQLQIAKSLLDECLNEWAADARPELRALVTSAFNTEKAGQINRSEIFKLLRMDIKDERWQQAMSAIRDAMRVVGSKIYVRCYHRETPDAGWEAITIDLAKA